MVAAQTSKGDSFVADKPRLWSEKKLTGLVNIERNVDLASDGKRVVGTDAGPGSGSAAVAEPCDLS
jgi:hypothetical protein